MSANDADREVLVSVVICTRNRAASLDRTLHSVRRAAERADGEWELVVVDNGSSDNTTEIVASHASTLPIKLVDEPVAGLSNARNAGVAASRGRFILWTDDDGVVHDDWLACWFAAFRRHADVTVFGGRTVPIYEEPRQEWLVANEATLGSLLVIRDEPSWQEITPERVPYGLNYAIRAEDQRAHLYDPELGVAPGRRRGGEETAVIWAILASGGRGRWVWDALVYHVIPAERQTIAYVERYYLADGYQYPAFGVWTGFATRAVAALVTLPKIGVNALRYALAKRRDEAASVPHLVTLARARGSLRRHLGLKPL